ncbi:NACHT, LRR and PYD domains-containing protein 1b allele 2 isoform X1 [Mobula hypostoma]|uniref:NACHT, LRR and PYD domains-containing protein 1b allele 2 isoform X1 n=1 Tax=Mobula hypostoma TaxID=723540 RepID=UPI002FC35724
MVADFSVEEMQASEEKAPLRDAKEENPDAVEHSESGSDDDSCTGSEKTDSDSDTSEADSDQGTEVPHLLKADPGDCSTEDTTTVKSDPDLYIKPSCPSCDSQTNQNFEQVTPRLISEERFCLKLDHEGTYQCVTTGLVFEVTEKVDIVYSILSWYKYDTFLKDNWKLCGPLFEVKSDPTLIKSIYFPHSLCLANHLPDLKFKILHIKDQKAEIEPITDHSTTHVQWNVSSLSPVGPIFQTTSLDIQHHGVVLIYKIINDHQSLLFHVYMAANNDSVIKDIIKAEKHAKQKSVRIDKPSACCKKLTNGKTYRLLGEPHAEIIPEEIEFMDMTSFKCKSYFEVYLEQREDLQLKLVDKETDEVIWTSKLRECDWANHKQNEQDKQRDVKQNRRRKSSTEIFVEDNHVKKPRWDDIGIVLPDGLTCKKNNNMTDKQLMQLAEKLGSNWQVIAIRYLDLEYQDISKIREEHENPTMQKFSMLQIWKNKELNNATPSNLHNKLFDADISYEARNVLEDFCN